MTFSITPSFATGQNILTASFTTSDIHIVNNDGIISFDGQEANYSYASQTNASHLASQWFQYDADINCLSGKVRLGNSQLYYNQVNHITTSAQGGGTFLVQQNVGFSGTVSNISAKAFLTSSLFGNIVENLTPNVNLTLSCRIAEGSLGGIFLNLDSATNPQNYVVAYINENHYLQIKKCVAGVISVVLAATYIPYIDNQNIQFDNSADTYKVFYNGKQIGTDFTIPELTENILHGAFSTSENNVFGTLKAVNSIVLGDNALTTWTSNSDNIVVDGDNITFDGNELIYTKEYASQDLPTGFYQINGTSTRTSGQFNINLGGGKSYYNSGNFSAAKLCLSGKIRFGANGSNLYEGTLSGITAKPISIASMLSNVTNQSFTNGTIQQDITLPNKDVTTGIFLNVDSDTNPQNWVFVYLEGTKNLCIAKCVNGVITQLFSKYNAAFNSSGGKLLVKIIDAPELSSLAIDVYYCDIKVTSIAITDLSILSGTIYASGIANLINSVDNFELTSNSGSQSNIANITVTNDIVKVLSSSHNFVGANVDPFVYLPDINNVPIKNNTDRLAKQTKMLHLLGYDCDRYPMGVNVSIASFDPRVPATDIESGLQYESTQVEGIGSYRWQYLRLGMYTMEWLRYRKSIGGKITWQLNNQSYFDAVNKRIIKYRWKVLDAEGNVIAFDWVAFQEYVDSLTDIIQYLKDEDVYDVIEYFEIGNEDWNSYNGNKDFVGYSFPDEYAKAVNILTKKLKSIDSNAKVIITYALQMSVDTDDTESDLGEDSGTDVGVDTDDNYSRNTPIATSIPSGNYWVDGVFESEYFQEVKNDIYAFVVHRSMCLESFMDLPTAKINATYGVKNNRKYMQLIYNHLTSYGITNPRVFQNEFNSGISTCNDLPIENYNKSWMVAFTDAQYLVDNLASSCCYHVDRLVLFNQKRYGVSIYNKTGGWGCYSVFYAYNHPKLFLPQFNAYVDRFFNKNILSTVVNSISDNTDVRVSTTTNGNIIQIFITNAKTDKIISLDLSVITEDLSLNIMKTMGHKNNLSDVLLPVGQEGSNPKKINPNHILLQKNVGIKNGNIFTNITLKANTLNCLIFRTA